MLDVASTLIAAHEKGRSSGGLGGRAFRRHIPRTCSADLVVRIRNSGSWVARPGRNRGEWWQGQGLARSIFPQPCILGAKIKRYRCQNRPPLLSARPRPLDPTRPLSNRINPAMPTEATLPLRPANPTNNTDPTGLCAIAQLVRE